MNKAFLFIFILFLSFVVNAQKKCSSHLTIKVYDSLTGKSLKDARVILRTKKWAIYGYTNKHGVAKFNLGDTFKLDLTSQTYIIQASSFMYHRRDSIILNPSSDCFQKVYLIPWSKKLIKKIREHGYGTSPVQEW